MIITTLLTSIIVVAFFAFGGSLLASPLLLLTLIVLPFLLFLGYLVVLSWRSWRVPMTLVRGTGMLAGAVGVIALSSAALRFGSLFLEVLVPQPVLLIFWALLVLLALIAVIGVARRLPAGGARAAAPAASVTAPPATRWQITVMAANIALAVLSAGLLLAPQFLFSAS